MLDIALTYFSVASALTLVLYALDKLFAKIGARRIPERTLLFASAVGGAIGASLGMLLFRHKIKKPRFLVSNLLGLVLHTVIITIIANLG